MKNRRNRSDAAYTMVETAAQIRAMTSILRQNIMDTVQAMQQVSVPELADQLGRPADALYYHVRVLQHAGLLIDAGVRRRGRHSETVYSAPQPGRRLKLRYRNSRNAATEPLCALVASMLRNSRHEFEAAIVDRGCIVEGPRRELWAGRTTGWLSNAELARANRLITELDTLFSSPRSGRRNRLYSLQFLLAPAAKPKSKDRP